MLIVIVIVLIAIFVDYLSLSYCSIVCFEPPSMDENLYNLYRTKPAWKVHLTDCMHTPQDSETSSIDSASSVCVCMCVNIDTCQLTCEI